MNINIKYFNESGYAAIIISMLIMVIIGLIALGFSATTRNEQQVTLDNALSTEAYYAAESGVNSAYSVIAAYEKAGQNLSSLPQQTNNCLADNNGNSTYSSTSSSKLNTTFPNSSPIYSCLLVNSKPYSLEYKPILQNIGESFPVQNSTSGNITQINVSWQSHLIPGPLTFSGCPSVGNLPPLNNYLNCSAPVLELDIVPMNDVIQNTTFIIDNTSNYFIFPYNGTYSVGNNFTKHTLGGNCSPVLIPSGEFSCNVSITPTIPSNGYYIHIVPYYTDADVSITAYASSLSPISFFGSQALIDATGQASGVSKRIEERICISTLCSNQAPNQAILSQNNICKYFTARPGVITNRNPGTCSGP